MAQNSNKKGGPELRPNGLETNSRKQERGRPPIALFSISGDASPQDLFRSILSPGLSNQHRQYAGS